MQLTKKITSVLCLSMLFLVACDSKKDQTSEQINSKPTQQQTAEVLPYLNIQEVKADYALPFCEKKKQR